MAGIAAFANAFAPTDDKRTGIRLAVCLTIEANGTCTILLGGSSLSIAGVPYLNGTVFQGGDVVVVLRSGADYIVLGGLANASSHGFKGFQDIIGRIAVNQGGAINPDPESYVWALRQGPMAHVLGRLNVDSSSAVSGGALMIYLPDDFRPKRQTIDAGATTPALGNMVVAGFGGWFAGSAVGNSANANEFGMLGHVCPPAGNVKSSNWFGTETTGGSVAIAAGAEIAFQLSFRLFDS